LLEQGGHYAQMWALQLQEKGGEVEAEAVAT